MTRAVLALLALPGLVAGAVPLLLAWLEGGGMRFSLFGLLPMVPGVALLLWCVREFRVAGRGTLAPWAPPRALVTTGPYRISRNPMYVAVVLVLAGWAIGFGSVVLAVYAAAVLIAFVVRVRIHEEPRLARAFRTEWTRYAARVPRWMPPGRPASHPPRRWTAAHAGAAALGVLVLIAAGGLVYEAFAEGRDARDVPPPGALVDIGGRRLHLICLGEGAPTVIVHPGGWETALDALEARTRMAARTRVCSYDPRGRGWSDPGPGVASAAELANDLGVLQDRAPLDGPFILVGVSLGGLTTEMFARLYPERAAGLVFVDAANSLALPLLTPHADRIAAATCPRRALAYLGVIRLLDPLGFGDGSEEGRRGVALTYTARGWSGLCAMARGVVASREGFDDAPPLNPEMPLVVLSATTGGDPPSSGASDAAWIPDAVRAGLVESHQQLAQRSSRGTWQHVPESTHPLAESHPDVVAQAVIDMVAEVRARTPRPRPARTID